ncbi:two-component system response regulator [Planctomycetota bacterium]|nr:two-component system response regulator [Planctomycetota bacterium]
MPPKVLLLVEDNPHDEALTLRAFRKANLSNPVVVVRDGIEALDWLWRQGAYADRDPQQRVAVVLLDLKLPKIDGAEVLRRLRADDRTRLIPVVILTTSTEEADVIRGYANGANSYLRKPVDFGQFMTTVAQLGVYWLAVNELAPEQR